MQGLVDAVRATGVRNVLVAGGLAYANDLSGVINGHALDDPGGDGIVYSSHCYNWHKGLEQHVLGAAARFPILAGECGVDPMKMNFIPAAAQEDYTTWAPDMLGFLQKVSPELDGLLHASAFFAADVDGLELHADAVLGRVREGCLGRKAFRDETDAVRLWTTTGFSDHAPSSGCWVDLRGSWVEAALWMRYTKAHGAPIAIAGVKTRDTVVIAAAPSSIGLAAIQIANGIVLSGATLLAGAQRRRRNARPRLHQSCGSGLRIRRSPIRAASPAEAASAGWPMPRRSHRRR